MQADIRQKLSMAERALEFSKAHSDTDPSYSAVVSELEERVHRADLLIVQERIGRVDEHSAVVHRGSERKALERRLRHLARVAKYAGRTRPELVPMFKLVEVRSPNQVLLAAAKSMLAAAITEKDTLLGVGLGQSFLDRLRVSVNEFGAATSMSNSGRIGHVGARAELLAVTGESVMLVGLLDGLNRERFGDDAQLLAAWQSASHVVMPLRRSAPDAEGAA